MADQGKLNYRGVSYNKADKPQNEHRHGDNLTYRGVDYDGAEAEKQAQAAASAHKKIYRGAEQKR